MVQQTLQAQATCLYVSQLAPGFDFTVVQPIVHAARAYNATHRIRGALVFDGYRFGQLIVGPERGVTALMSRIQRDPRHAGVRLLHSGPALATALMQTWSSGYCDATALDALVNDDGPRGEAAVAAFLTLLATADLD